MLNRMPVLLLAATLCAVPAYAEELITLEVASSCRGPAYLHYREGLAVPILERFSTPRGDPLVRVARAVLEPGGRDTLAIVFSDGASCDPDFWLYWADGRRVERKPPNGGYCSGATHIAIPGDGYFYTWGHTNSHFDIHRKFRIVDSLICEVEQPYYYVGLRTVALKDLNLTSDLEGGTAAATVSAGDSITVLLNSGYSFLVKARFDIIGWWRMKDPNAQRPAEVGGIFFSGD